MALSCGTSYWSKWYPGISYWSQWGLLLSAMGWELSVFTGPAIAGGTGISKVSVGLCSSGWSWAEGHSRAKFLYLPQTWYAWETYVYSLANSRLD